MWPISAATLLTPRQSFLLITIPPPIPVPMVSITRESASLPAPTHFSPHAAALASFSKTQGTENLSDTMRLIGMFRHSGRLGENKIVSPFLSTRPGDPSPTPIILVGGGFQTGPPFF